MKTVFATIMLGSLAMFANADPIPQAVADAAIAPRQFSTEMLNPDITQANIHDTICRKGFTKTIRPAVVYTNGVKFKLMREAGIPETDADKYELDHIVPLAVGGHPRKLVNLMLQPYEGKLGARQKDRLELKLHDLVCSSGLALASAQQEIGNNWVSAYRKYVLYKREQLHER